MAVELQKVLAVLDLKFKGKSVSKDFKKNLATKWAPKIETEAEIDDYVEDRIDVIDEAAAEGDRRATAAAKKVTTETVKKIKGEPSSEDDDEPTDPVEKIMKMMQSFKSELDTLKAEKTAASIGEKFTKDERLKGIPAVLLKGITPKSNLSDEDFDALVEQTATELKPYIQIEGGGKRGGIERPGSIKTSATGGIVAPTGDETKPTSNVEKFIATNLAVKSQK